MLLAVVLPALLVTLPAPAAILTPTVVSPVTVPPVTVMPAIWPSLMPSELGVIGPTPVPVTALRHPHQGSRDALPVHPEEMGPWRPRAIPAVSATGPIPTAADEHLVAHAFHHLDAGLNLHERRRSGQVQIDVDPHLGAGRRQEGQGERETTDELHHVLHR